MHLENKKIFCEFSFRNIMFADRCWKKCIYFSIFSYFAAWTIPWQSANNNPTAKRRSWKNNNQVFLRWHIGVVLTAYYHQFVSRLSVFVSLLHGAKFTRTLHDSLLENKTKKNQNAANYGKKIPRYSRLDRTWRVNGAKWKCTQGTRAEDNGGGKK